MPISRIDMISIPPKTQEVTQYRQNELAKTFAEHVNIKTEFQNERLHNSKQTVKSSKSDKEKSFDAKEKGSNSYQGQNKEQRKRDGNEATEIKLSNFDIKI